MNLNRAITKVGKAMAEAKFDDAMGGAMLPHGNLSAAGTISVIYGISYREAERRLARAMKPEYKKICDKHAANVRKREAEHWRNKKRKKK